MIFFSTGDAIDMFISIMQNIDLKTLVSIANDPIENEVDALHAVGTTTEENLDENPATEKPFTLGQILTGEATASVTTAQAAPAETEPVSTLPSAVQPTTTDPRPDESQLTTTDEKEQFTDASIVRVENGVHVVMPVGWFEPNEDKKNPEEVSVDQTTTTAPVAVAIAAVETTVVPEVETAAAVAVTTVPAETSPENVEEEKSAATTTATAAESVEQVTTESGVVVIINGEVVPTTTAPSGEVEASLTTTNVVTTTAAAADIPETDRTSGRKTLPRVFRPRSRTSTTTTTLKTTTTEDESEHEAEGEGERPRFANQRNRIRQRLRSQHTGTSASRALEILNSRAKTEQKQKTTEEPEAAVVETEDASESPTEGDEASEVVPGAEVDDAKNPSKVKKERTKLNVPKLVDRRNELFKKRVPITHAPPAKAEATESVPASTAAPKAIFANPARRPFKFTPSTGSEAIATELTATSDSVSTASPESATKPKSVRCRLFRRACTDEDASTTTTTTS
jgi:hypothetical protein